MGQATLKVPPHHVHGLRLNVYGRLACEGDTLDKTAGPLGAPWGRRWHEQIRNEDPEKQDATASKYASKVREATQTVAALVAVMDQLGWNDQVDEEALEISAAADLLEGLLGGYLVDLSGALGEGSDGREAEAIRWEMERVEWVLTQREAIGAAA